MWQGVLEAAANLMLSIGLTIWMRSILGVAWGSVIPTVVLGWGLLWGWAAKEAGLSRGALFSRVVLRAWLGCLPMVAVAAGVRLQPWWVSGSTTPLMLGEGTVVAAVGLLGIWQLSFTPEERARFMAKFGRKLRLKPGGQPA
jgi:hypothetical protein